jgi:hypothetical protein
MSQKKTWREAGTCAEPRLKFAQAQSLSGLLETTPKSTKRTLQAANMLISAPAMKSFSLAEMMTAARILGSFCYEWLQLCIAAGSVRTSCSITGPISALRLTLRVLTLEPCRSSLTMAMPSSVKDSWTFLAAAAAGFGASAKRAGL